MATVLKAMTFYHKCLGETLTIATDRRYYLAREPVWGAANLT